MREEWSIRGWSTESAASSWNRRRLVASALVVALDLLGLGVGVAGLLTPDSVAAGDPTAAVLGATEVAPETEIGDAAAAVREGPFAPAPTAHLTVVHVSVSVCGRSSPRSSATIAASRYSSAVRTPIS